jgi:hypothetical protein
MRRIRPLVAAAVARAEELFGVVEVCGADCKHFKPTETYRCGMPGMQAGV